MDHTSSILPDTVACRMHAPGKQPVRIDRWKFEAIRGAILKFLSMQKKCAHFDDLVAAISRMLRPDILGRLGPVSLYTTVVMLEMEVTGEIKRWNRSDPEPMV